MGVSSSVLWLSFCMQVSCLLTLITMERNNRVSYHSSLLSHFFTQRILQWHAICTPNPQWSQWSFSVVCMQECIFLEGSGAFLYFKGAGFDFASPFRYRRFEVLSHFRIQLTTPSLWLIHPGTQQKILCFQGNDWMVTLEMWFHLTLCLLHKLG